MLRNSFLFFFLSFTLSLFSQNKDKIYITYYLSDDKNFDFHKRQHYLTFDKEKLCVEIMRKGDLMSDAKIFFHYTKENDTIFVGKRILIKESKGLRNKLFDEFENQKIVYISENELYLINANRPYFSRKYINRLRGNNVIFSINGVIKKIKKRKVINVLKYYIEKKASIRFIQGEECFRKYGAIGIGQIIEVTENKMTDLQN
ncbi:hypothetical protein [Capnocytophaga canimorsus]|uniref:hypothetical protein n=1 Tax=Capnocytophaga canimorsus TaxID=28188 RepID=UPI00385FB208